MHTTEYEEDEFIIRFHHNGDFSGMVTISLEWFDGKGGEDGELKIPFDAMKMLVAEYLRHKIITVIEQADTDTILRTELLNVYT